MKLIINCFLFFFVVLSAGMLGSHFTLFYTENHTAIPDALKIPTLDKWDQGIVTYHFHEDMDKNEKRLIKLAMKAWQDKTDLEFKPLRLTPGMFFTPRHVLFETWEKGYSLAELPTLLNQVLEVKFREGFSLTTAKHEVGHVIGLFHEHQRWDRDRYITVKDLRTIPQAKGFAWNLTKVMPTRYHPFGPYDYHSIMHYSSMAFETKTFQPFLLKNTGKLVPYNTMISPLDVNKVQYMYKDEFEKRKTLRERKTP